MSEELLAMIIQSVVAVITVPVVTLASRWLDNAVRGLDPIIINLVVLPLATALSQALLWVVAAGNLELSPAWAVVAMTISTWAHEILKNAGLLKSTLKAPKSRLPA